MNHPTVRRLCLFAALVAAALLLNGCANFNHLPAEHTNQDLRQQFTNGKSTTRDVARVLGEPDRRELREGSLYWYYEKRLLIFEFDPGEILRQISNYGKYGKPWQEPPALDRYDEGSYRLRSPDRLRGR
jgi:hypothetical protein